MLIAAALSIFGLIHSFSLDDGYVKASATTLSFYWLLVLVDISH